jgi:hypothetical protein
MHRLNMELDLHSLFWHQVHSDICTHFWLRPHDTPPPPQPRNWAHIRGLYWSMVSQDKRHLFVNPSFNVSLLIQPNSGLNSNIAIH